MSKWSAAIFAPFFLLFIFSLVTASVASSFTIDFPMAQVQASIKNRLYDHSANPVFNIQNDAICGMEMMPLAYRSRAYTPFWFDGHRRLKAAKALIEAIGRAGEDGLLPVDYHLVAIYRLLAEMVQERSTRNSISPERWADLDLIMTDAFLLLGTHLSVGKVNPQTLHAQWKIDPGRVTLLPLLTRAATTGDVAGALDELRPSHKEYAALRSALAQLRKIAATGGWITLENHLTLRLGDRSDGVEALRRRLIAGGEFVPPVQSVDSHRFDEGVAKAVKRFQRHHGLDDDGIVGPETIGMLNVSVEKRIRQTEINLERWRWLPHQLGRRYIMVNTAAFTLDAVEVGQVVLRMRVVVGQPARRSPVFSSNISHLVVNPYWTVPATIAVEDILPAVQKDTDYLTERGIRVYSTWQADAFEIDPATVNWHAYHKDRFPFTLRQDPGPHNALGHVKFMFPNEFDVYLHDTPDHMIFNRVRRDFSSGCIRVEWPLALAHFVISDDERWTPQRVTELFDSGDTLTIQLEHPVPVHLLYMTAWTDPWGVLQFRSDIYHQDALLDRALDQQRHTNCLSILY